MSGSEGSRDGEPGGRGGHAGAAHGTAIVVAVVLVVTASVALAVLGNFRLAAYALASLLAALAVARALLPVRFLGPLVVRSRVVDVVTAGALSAALVVLAEGVPL